MLEEMSFSQDDFTRSNWRDVITSAEKRTCESYGQFFIEASKKAREAGDAPLSQVFLLLHAASFLWLRPEEHHQPFAPIWQGADGSRSIDVSDFTESHINLFKVIYDHIDDPELKSRIGDVIWTYQHRGNFQFAETAVDAYLQAGESFLQSEDYYFGIDRFTRAIHLAASLGRNSRKFSEVIARIEILIDQHAPIYSPFVGQLVNLLFEYRQGDPVKYALITESLADFEQQRRVWYFARGHWNAAVSWYRLGKNPDAAQICQLKGAECYVFEAEDALKNSQGPRHSIAAHHLQSAIEAYRRVPGTEARQNELHIRMLQIQESSGDESGSISGEIDLTKHVEKALREIKDKPFIDALFTFCLLGSSPGVNSLRETIERIPTEHPLLSWISMNVVDDRGRVVGRRGSIFSGTPKEIEDAKIAEMHRQARYEKEALAVVVNAARFQLIVEHNFELHDLLELTTNHPFIPPERELIFARGFQAGFHGDFLKALHLLVPQVENSLRFLLNHQGVVTSKLSSEGIQEEMDLNALLEMPEIKEILGKNLVFDLQGTLTSRFGYNFRNLMAHGLLDQQSFHSYPGIYIWWLLLRICCLPLIAAQKQEENPNAPASDQ